MLIYLHNFFPLIKAIAKTGKPIIMSTGLMEMEEVKHTADFICNIWDKNNIKQDMALLHCVAMYPTPPEQTNLLAIRKLQEIASTVGYSDHALGIDAAVFSVGGLFSTDDGYSRFHHRRR